MTMIPKRVFFFLTGCAFAFLATVAVADPTGGVPLATSDGFAIPQPGAVLTFPRDHGAHPDFRIEWWYLTGHLQTSQGRRFGYQATFFRTALHPPTEDLPDATDRALFLGHMALSDWGEEKFRSEERLARAGWDAHAADDGLDLRINNWTLRMTDGVSETMKLNFTIEGEVLAQLTLRPQKPLVRFGEDGTSRKGSDPAARSYYLTFPRLQTNGVLTLGDDSFEVSGESWMDHEIASRQLSDKLVGWDWTAVQLEDGWEIKAYILRQPDGSADAFSRLFWIAPEGSVVERDATEFDWKRARWWTSPTSGQRYPIDVDLRTIDPRSGEPVTLRLRAAFEDQELTGASAGFAYWEGAGDVLDESGAIIGQSYLELVGYGNETAGSRLR